MTLEFCQPLLLTRSSAVFIRQKAVPVHLCNMKLFHVAFFLSRTIHLLSSYTHLTLTTGDFFKEHILFWIHPITCHFPGCWKSWVLVISYKLQNNSPRWFLRILFLIVVVWCSLWSSHVLLSLVVNYRRVLHWSFPVNVFFNNFIQAYISNVTSNVGSNLKYISIAGL